MTYTDLKDEIQNIYTELSYNSRYVRIAMFHLIGQTLIDNEKVALGKLEKLSDATNIALDDLEYAIIFADLYPRLEDFNHDKRINWHKIKEDLMEGGKNDSKLET